MRSDSSIEFTLCLLFEPSRLSDATSARMCGDGERRGTAFDVPGGKTFVPGAEHDRGLMVLIGAGQVEVSVSISPEWQEEIGDLIVTSACCGSIGGVTLASLRDEVMYKTAGVGSSDAGRWWGPSNGRDGTGEDFPE